MNFKIILKYFLNRTVPLDVSLEWCYIHSAYYYSYMLFLLLLFLLCTYLTCIWQVLELLWDLAHLPALPTALIEQALDEHLAILNDSYAIKELVKNNYAFKCVDEIKEVATIYYLLLLTCLCIIFYYAIFEWIVYHY